MMEATADYCTDLGAGITICRTRMKEHSRRSEGEKWCFTCRKRHEFWWVVDVPDGFSCYGPNVYMKGTTNRCTDLFPGWVREPIEE